MKRRNHIALAGLLVLGASGWFLLSTVLLDELPDEVLVLAAALASLATLAALGVPSRADLKRLGGAQLAWSALAGVLMLAVSPLVILANRFTDAPPGSETLFLTTSAWAGLALLASAFLPRGRANLRQVAFVCAGVVGGAALLANWERPSSFSPFVRYPSQDLAFLAAGAIWLAGGLILIRSKSQHDTHPAQVVAAAAGAGAAFIALALSGKLATISQIPSYAGVLLAASVLSSAVFVGWLVLAGRVGVAATSALWLLPPVAITGFGVFEQAFSPRGPDPVIWPGALAGITLAVLGALGAWLSRDAGSPAPARAAARSKTGLAAAFLSVAAFGTAAVALGLPAIEASVKGSLTSGQAYSAQWNLLGFETAGGWAAVVAGVLLISSALDALSTRRPGRILASATVCAVVLGAYYYLASTPLHTWTRWVPVEIQSEYGTEYTLLQFATVHNPMRLAALALGAAAVVALCVNAVAVRRSQEQSPAPSEVSE